MNALVHLTLGLLLISNNAIAQYRLEIVITGVKNEKGNMMFQLFDENEKLLHQEIGKIKDGRSEFIINDRKPGKYAVRYYHDENMNGIMEKNLVGKPLEGYGFSNNVIDKFGPPPFRKWIFDLKENKRLDLKITY